MTLGELKTHIEDLIAKGIDENTPLKIMDRESYRFHDMEVNFDQIFVDEKNKLSGSGYEALTCFHITE